MNPADVARLHASSRAGFHLVGYQEVGLPHWEINLNCMILSHKPIPPLMEFVLRAVGAGIGAVPEVAGLLGLDERTVTASMVPLYQDGYIRPSLEDPDSFEMTKSGQLLARSCEMVVPEEIALPLEYDGWTRELVDLGSPVKYTRADLQKLGITPLPAFPDAPPAADEFTVAEARRLTSEQLNREYRGKQVMRRDILSIEGLHDKRRAFFLKAVALLFRSIQTGESQVAFAIDGRLSQVHEDAFARAAGLKKLGVLEALKQSVSDVALLELDPDVVGQLEQGPEVTELAQSVLERKREVAQIETSLAQSNGAEGAIESGKEVLEAAREKLAKAEARLTQYPVRMLEVFEHPDVLEEALREASERLLIVSPWVKNAVVNRSFLELLEGALQRAVDVTICYGINRRRPEEGSDPEAVRSLRALEDVYGNFIFSALGDTHAKVLVLDHRYVVVTSFNWLSFKGDPSKPFRDERGVLVAIPSKIDAEYDKYMERVAEVVELDDDED